MMSYKVICDKYEDLKKENFINRKEIVNQKKEIEKLKKENIVLLNILLKNKDRLKYD